MKTARRAAIVGATLAAVAAATMGSAGAASISGFSNAPHVTPLHMLLIILFIPLGLAIVLSLIILLPGILRGEGLVPLPFKDGEDAQDRSHGH
jgi:hypothetical protein